MVPLAGGTGRAPEKMSRSLGAESQPRKVVGEKKGRGQLLCHAGISESVGRGRGLKRQREAWCDKQCRKIEQKKKEPNAQRQNCFVRLFTHT